MVFTCPKCGSKIVMPGVEERNAGRVVCGRCSHVIFDPRRDLPPPKVDPRVFRHVVRLRMNGINDEAIRANLFTNSVSREAAEEAIRALDQAHVREKKDERPTLVGWLLILVAIVVCAGAGLGIGMLCSGAPMFLKTILAIPAVVAGIGVMFGLGKILEGLGIRISYIKRDATVTESMPIDFSEAAEGPW